MNSSAKHAPATRPAAAPAIGRPVVPPEATVPEAASAAVPEAASAAVPEGVSATVPEGASATVPEAALADTPTMAGSASTIPVIARAVGRSPSSSPASTENPAAPTALIGPATLNAACRNPRYSANAPMVPPRPATAPQARAAAPGGWDAAKGSAAVTTSALTAEASSVTRMTPALREASPAAKSEPP